MSEYIKREQVLKLLESAQAWGWSMNTLYDEIQALPAEDVAPVVHGKWEWFGPCYDGNGKFWGTCSVCQTRQRLGDYYTHCPVCGAKIDL